jgi:pyruvate carboxylase
MRRALRELQIEGVRTTQPFHLAVLDDPDFGAGDISVRYLEKHPRLVETGKGDWHARAAAVAATLLEHRGRKAETVSVSSTHTGDRGAEISEWRRRLGAVD